MISEKIERLVEESIQDIYLKAKGFFFGKYFKDLTEEEYILKTLTKNLTKIKFTRIDI